MEINFLAVVLAALAAFFLGFIWYTVILAKPWQAEIGMNARNPEAKAPNMGRMLIGSLILELIMAYVLATFIGTGADWMFGLHAGLLAGFGFVAMAFGVNYLFEGKSLRLWGINAGYNVVVFAIMGLIIGAM